MAFLFVIDFFVFLFFPMVIYLLFTQGWPLWKAFGVVSLGYLVYLHVIWFSVLGGYPLAGGLLVAHILTLIDGVIPWHDHQPGTVYRGHSESEVTQMMVWYSSISICLAPTLLLWVFRKKGHRVG